MLDEPTNHLDIEMREALAEALQDYDGALVVVAHDRHLLRATTDELWLVADGRVVPFDGDLDDYRDWVLARSRRAAEPPSSAADGAQSQGAKARGGQARQRGLLATEATRRQARKVEREMAALDAERKAVEDWLASPAAYAEGERETLK